MNNRKYVLGLLSEKQKKKIEEAYFSDEAQFEKMIAAEDDLVEAYISDDLSKREKHQFESHLLSQPKWRQKVATVKALHQVVNERDSTAVQNDWLTNVIDRGRQWLSILFPPKRVFAFSYAVMILFVATAGLYTIRNSQNVQGQLSALEQQNSTLRNNEVELRSQLQQQSTRTNEVAAQLENERRQRLQLERETVAKAVLPTFFLQPGLRRDSGEQKRLTFPDAKAIRLELVAEFDLDYAGYSAVVKTVEGIEVWSSMRLKAADVQQGQTIVLELPRSLFSHQDYLLTLSGITQNGDVEAIHTYFFSVVE